MCNSPKGSVKIIVRSVKFDLVLIGNTRVSTGKLNDPLGLLSKEVECVVDYSDGVDFLYSDQ